MTEHFPGAVPDEVYTRPTSPVPDRERRIAILDRFLTDRRRQRIESTLAHRVGDLVMVVDAIYDLGNAAAIMRTCDGFGVHNVHFVESTQPYKPARRTTQGAHKWLSVSTYPTPAACSEQLHGLGFRLVGASLEGSIPLEELDVSGKVAVVLGSERDGLSPEMIDACDELYRIPMHGMVQSFNVSVAAAVTLHDVLRRRREHAIATAAGREVRAGDIPEETLDVMREIYYRLAIKNSEAILERALGVPPPPLPERADIYALID